MEADRVRRLAYFDAATGLPNRSQFNERLLRQLEEVQEHLSAIDFKIDLYRERIAS